MKFPGRSQLDNNPYPDVRGENLTGGRPRSPPRRRGPSNAHCLAVARYRSMRGPARL